jgi:hypothetical protein
MTVKGAERYIPYKKEEIQWLPIYISKSIAKTAHLAKRVYEFYKKIEMKEGLHHLL